MASTTLLLAALAPLATFMFVSSITPGPNNLMLLASGIRFGFGRTVPHLLGITGGMLLLLLVADAGVAALLATWPAVGGAMTMACSLYLLWLALALLRDDGTPGEGPAAQRPLGAFGAAMFQFVNPKAWAMAVAACALGERLPLAPAPRLLLLLAVTAAINLPCVAVWALFGRGMRQSLRQAELRRTFNWAMAALVLATAVWMLRPLALGLAMPAAELASLR